MIRIAKGFSNLEDIGHLQREMFEERKRIFFDLLRWDVPVVQDRYEMDQFDNENATYIIVEDGTGSHLGSARLLPTNRPHILDTLFPHLSGAEVPRGDTIFEITRFCLSPRISSMERRDVRRSLVSAFAVHAATVGIERYTGVADQRWYGEIAKFGWDCAPLSAVASTRLVAFRIEITPRTTTLLRATGMFSDVSLQPLSTSIRNDKLLDARPREEYVHAA